MSIETKSPANQRNVFAGDKSKGTLMRVQYSDLLLLNFEINDDLIRPHVPSALELAHYNESCFVSLVAKRVSKVMYGRFILPLMPYCTLGLRVCVQRKVNDETRMGDFLS